MSSGYPVARYVQRPNPVVVDKDGVTQSVAAIMNYVDASAEVAHIRRDTTGSDSGLEVSGWSYPEVVVKNARLRSSPFTLHTNGFELRDCPLHQAEPKDNLIDFLDTRDVMDRYYPICEKLLRDYLGPGVDVKSFDHNIRIEGSDEEELKNGAGSKVQKPLCLVHGDYTAVSAPRRLRDLAKPPKANDVWRTRLSKGSSLLDPVFVDEAVQGKRRYALINVWRSIDREHPVSANPLACVDAMTVTRDKLRTLQIHYPDRIGENYLSVHDDEHCWAFFDKMTFDEVILIKQWDSIGGLAQGMERETDCSSFSLHSSFLLPPSDTVIPARRSIEVRCVCIWKPNQ